MDPYDAIRASMRRLGIKIKKESEWEPKRKPLVLKRPTTAPGKKRYPRKAVAGVRSHSVFLKQKYDGLHAWVKAGNSIASYATVNGLNVHTVHAAARRMKLISQRTMVRDITKRRVHELAASGCLDTTTISTVVGIPVRTVRWHLTHL